MKKLLLSVCLSTALFSNETVVEVSTPTVQDSTPILDLDYLKSLQSGNNRDFYINQFLQKDITSEEAFDILSLINNVSNEIFFNFAKKFNHDETLAVAQCMNMDTKDLVESYADCIVTGLSINDMSKLSAIDLDLIKQKTEKKYPDFLKRVKILSSSIPFTKLIVQKKDDFYNIFLNVDDEFRTKYFNYKLPKRTFAKIFKDKEKFNSFLQVSLSNPKLDMLHNSLNGVDDSQLNFNSSFLLALNALRLNDLDSALTYLNSAILKTTDTKLLDKVKFWQYQITKDETILESLSTSTNLNFYSYIASEIQKKHLDDDSFLQKIEVFDENLKEYDKKRVALLYAIAKTKSNFDTHKISKNFEVGALQLKPSFVKSISDSLEEKYNLQKQFILENNLKFTNFYLNSLEARSKDVISLLLAYNGNKSSLKNIVLSSNNKFEPYFSFELLLNEKNEEIKDTLLYYVLYHNSLTKEKKEKISLSSIFENLNLPAPKLGE